MEVSNLDHLYEEILDQPGAESLAKRVLSALEEEKEERQRFRNWLRDDVKAEFINGKIVMHSPVKRGHLKVTERLFPLISTYVRKNNLGDVSSEKALIALTRNDYEPDIVYWTAEQAANFDDDTMVHPTPTLVVEILSRGTKAKDRGIKFKDYAEHGIKEYWMIDYQKKVVEQYYLPTVETRVYELKTALKVNDTLESLAIVDFSIPVAAVFDDEVQLRTLSEMLS